ncbi:hypothetical protein O0L34_g971 [Tuta absoluta]|nr:hypothetical protein O0L34_g971 [Tuta absoluta]
MNLIENEWFIEVPWGKLCTIAWGDCCNPPVLVVHGGGDNLASFRPLITLLPSNFYYVGIEIPGNGKSDCYPPGLPVHTLDMPYVIEIVRRHFRWESFIYMAHSFGGIAGKLYNLTHPGRIIAAIDLDQITPTLDFEIENFPKWYQAYYGAFYGRYEKNRLPIEKKPTYTWDQMIEKVRKNRPELTPELVRATIGRHSEPAGDGKIRLTLDTRRPYAFPPPFTREQYKTLFITMIDTPTLAVAAKDSIQKKLYKNTPFLLEDHKNYRVKVVEGGHDVHIAHPERVAPFVSQFLLYGLEGLDRRSKL